MQAPTTVRSGCLAYCKLSGTSWAELKPGSLPGQVVCTLLALLGCLISCCQELRLRLLLQPLLLSCCCLCRGQLLRFLPALAHGCSMMAGVVPVCSLPSAASGLWPAAKYT